jgi:hypothetical protein
MTWSNRPRKGRNTPARRLIGRTFGSVFHPRVLDIQYCLKVILNHDQQSKANQVESVDHQCLQEASVDKCQKNRSLKVSVCQSGWDI